MLDRRSFLAMSATGVALSAAELGCSGAGSSAGAAAPIAPPHAEIEEATIAELAGKMKRSEATAEALVAAYSARVEALDRAGPTLRAVIEMNPDAPKIAKALDEELAAKGPRGPLHGIPILLKDNIDSADPMHTTAGSLALVKAPAPKDAPLVERLRKAGAVILGKANLSEWANFRGDRSTSGWSARGGVVKNPYALDRNASGSSSGSAAAVAANLCAAAIGSETDGSIVSPASICGIVGLKPTVGLVSRTGMIPISRTQDTAGPMTRTVADTALVLAALAGADPRDAATAALAGKAAVDYAAALDPNAARGKRVGVVRGWKSMSQFVLSAFDRAVIELRAAGAEIVDDVSLGDLRAIDDPEMEVLLTEIKVGMEEYLAARGGPMRTLADLVAFNRGSAEQELSYFGQELFERAVEKGGLDAEPYRKALADCRRLSRDEGIDAALSKHKLDALMVPTGGVAWKTDLVNGDSFTGSSSTPAAVAGYPTITVPSEWVRGLPLGVSFIGPAWSEALLIGIAYAFEQRTKARKPPAYPAALDPGV
jgi:amidase